MRVPGHFLPLIRRSFALLICAAALTLASGCSGSEPAAPPPSMAGLYVLTTVDGKSLPATLWVSTSGNQSVTSGTLELTTSVYTRTLNFYDTFLNFPGGRSPLTTKVSGFGVYAVKDAAILFDPRGGDNAEFVLWPRSGVVSGASITYALDGHVYRFERQ